MLDGVDLPAGAMVSFEPGGPHMMFTDLTGPLEEGARVAATLTFEQAGLIEVEFNVEAHSTETHAHGSDG